MADYIMICILILCIFLFFHSKINFKIKWKNKKLVYFFFLLLVLCNLFVLYRVEALNSFLCFITNILQFFYAIEKIICFDVLVLFVVGGMYFKNKNVYFEWFIPIWKIFNIIEMNEIIIQMIQNRTTNKWFGNLETLRLIAVLVLHTVLSDIDSIKIKCSEGKKGLQYTEKFNVREEQKEELVKIICSNHEEKQKMILISDERGGGKTYFVKQVIEQAKKEKSFFVVTMDALEWKSREIFMSSLLEKIGSELKEKRYFLDSGNIEKYFETVLRIAMGDEATNAVSRPLGNFFGLYRKASLLECGVTSKIADVLGENHLLLVFDNIELCSEEIVKEMMDFFKNLILFPKCIIIVLADQKNLTTVKNISSQDILGYFTYICRLKTIDYEILVNTMQNSFEQMIKDQGLSEEYCSIKISQLLCEVITKVEQAISDKEKFCSENYSQLQDNEHRSRLLKETEKALTGLTSGLDSLKKKLSNPACIQVIYQDMYDKVFKINELLDMKSVQYKEIEVFLKTVYLPACLFYSLAMNLCAECFIDTSLEDDSKKDYPFGKILFEGTKGSKHEKIYSLIWYAFFGECSIGPKYDREKFWAYYRRNNLKEYMKPVFRS